MKQTAPKPKEMSEQRFLDHVYESYSAGQRYCFVLGAGASRASGIRTGEELMREWRDYLVKKGSDYIDDCARELGLKKKAYQSIFEDGSSLKNDDYFTLFDLRFAGKPNVAYAYLEKEMEGKYPSYGYYPLAMLLSNTQNKLVITTNFDTLLEDSLYTYTFRHPLIVGHESLASYISHDTRHPIIAKIHRDLFFSPLNRQKDMNALKAEWEKPLRNALSKYTPIVIGYAGGDRTFMSLLQSAELNGIYWCYIGEEPDNTIKGLVQQHDGYLIKILGFDEIMFQLGEQFSKEAQFGDPCQYVREQAEKKCKLYQESFDKIKEKYETKKLDETSASQHPGEEAEGIVDAIERYHSRQVQVGETEAEQEIRNLLAEARTYTLNRKYEDALDRLNRLIALEPERAEFYDRRSTVLHNMKRYKEALKDAEKTISLEPDVADHYASKAITLIKMNQFKDAYKACTAAIRLDDSVPSYYHRRAVVSYNLGQYKDDLADETKAIELDPTNAKYYQQRAITLRKLDQKDLAEQDEAKAKELEEGN